MRVDPLALFVVWGLASAAWTAYELFADGAREIELIPRCLRCGGMRGWMHRCPDAEGGGEGREVGVDR